MVVPQTFVSEKEFPLKMNVKKNSSKNPEDQSF